MKLYLKYCKNTSMLVKFISVWVFLRFDKYYQNCVIYVYLLISSIIFKWLILYLSLNANTQIQQQDKRIKT